MSIRRLPKALILRLILIASALLLWPLDGRAASDAFTVGGIRVDVTAETAAAAREAAHAQGHVLAMQKLLARLLPRAELARTREFKASEVLRFVQDFQVTNERTSDVRYLASLTFRFKPAPVRQLIQSSRLQHAETMSKPVVVLPVFGAEAGAVLWDDSNPWWGAWSARPPGDWLVPLIVPLGDLGDLTAIDAGRALAGDAQALGAVAARYGAEDVLVTQVVLHGDPESGPVTLQVGTSRLGRYAQQTVVDVQVQDPNETLADLFARTVEAVDSQVQEAWKQANLLRPGSERWIAATIPVGKLADWLEVKRRLQGVAAVRRVEVTALSRRKTEVAITFVGEEEQLVLAMAQSDLNLALYPGTGWELQLAASGTVQPAPTPVTPPSGGDETPQLPAATEPGAQQQPGTGSGEAAPAPNASATE